ncbi:MAG: S8 family serine peptidase [Acidimicrobiales bacterium]
MTNTTLGAGSVGRRLAVAAVVLGGLLSPGLAGADPADRNAAASDQHALRDRYIVLFRRDTPDDEVGAAREQSRGRGGQVHHDYANAVRGFAATLPAQALEGLRRNPNVELIEPDAPVVASVVQTGATWGLDRIDQRALPLSGTYSYDTTGAGVTAYIIDTGVRATHTQFGGRVTSGYTAIADGRGTDDCNGHGTHVSGTVGGATYGVAKQVRLVAVRVLDCSGSGTNSGVIAGVDWVTAQHLAGQPAVANMSLGGSVSTALDTAVANSIADGVSYAVAAGNSNANACNTSPARAAAAMTVGATTSTDGRASFSNYGTCLDLFAPGSGITSAWSTSDTAVNTISGTSMAAPHVAGVAALYLQTNPGATATVVRDAVVAGATANVVSSPGTGSPDRLLYSLLGAAPPPPPPGPVACSLPETYGGSLSGAGDYDYHPNGTYFYRGAGTHKGCLRGPAGTEFNVYLWRWSGLAWVTVAQGVSGGSNEDVTYAGTAGYYVWRVESAAGSGSYTFAMQRP